MRVVVLLAVLIGCGFESGYLPPGDTGDGGGSNLACAWSYTPTNFDPCELPAPAALRVSQETMLDTAATTLPKQVIQQSDGSSITVIHLTSLIVDPLATLTVNGSGVVFAVEEEAQIHGRITAIGGNDADAHCSKSRGGNATDSMDVAGGGGGGGGAAAAEDGGDGGDGSGQQSGAKGGKGSKASSTLSPLRGGCRGGNGGRYNMTGTAPAGGRGGGAVQISSNTKVTVNGIIDAAGRGGFGGSDAHVGAGGGGSGGGIFLEAPNIDLGFVSQLCADGASGGEGGGVTVLGKNGEMSPCTSIQAATTNRTTNSAGGEGGAGGYAASRTGKAAGSAQSTGGGGGGGGAVGWIRIKSPNVDDSGSVVSPGPSTN